MSDKPNCGDTEFGALLRQYRGLRGLTQVELAERSGLNVQAVSMLERGVRRAPRSTTVEFLAQALKLDAGQKDAFVAAARGAPMREQLLNGTPASMPTDILPLRTPLPAGSRMPLAPNPLFVGRSDELVQVAAAIASGDTVALGQVVASTGLGGLGKTQLAVEFVHRYGRFFGGGVFWLSFASADEIPLQVAACAGPEFESQALEERVKLVQSAWQSAMPRLLVFDNCEEESLLEAWRPTSGGCRVLVTSRRSHWSPTLGVTVLPLDLLPRPDSIELLRQYRPDLSPNDPGLDTIAAELGDLPLALHLAGSYLRSYRAEVSVAGYRAELRRADVVQHASLLGAGLDDAPSPTHHLQSVAATFALCLGRLDRSREVDQLAITLLARMAYMAPGEPVPRDLLAKTMEDVDPLLRADGLRRLGAVGLVEEGEGWLRMHRLLVHFVRKEALDPDAPPAVDRALIDCGDDAVGHLTGSALAAVIPHLVDAASRNTGDELRTAQLDGAVGLALQHAGDLRAARPWLEHALETRSKVSGPYHADTAVDLNNLAYHLQAQGELTAARPLYERAAEIRRRTLGPDHPDTVAVLNNLALLLRAQGDLGTARPIFELALETRERVLGANHRLTAHSLNNLGLLLADQGELIVARPLLERSLAIRERVLGPDHPDTANGLYNLARLVHSQGEVTVARSLMERSLVIREHVLGPDHYHTAASLHNLARLHRDEGDPAAARPLLERALAIRERVFGPDHPDTVATRRALAELGEDGGAAARG